MTGNKNEQDNLYLTKLKEENSNLNKRLEKVSREKEDFRGKVNKNL